MEETYKPKTSRRWALEPWQLKALKDLMEGPGFPLLEALFKDQLRAAHSRLEHSVDFHEMLRAQGEVSAVGSFMAKLKEIYSSMEGEKD